MSLVLFITFALFGCIFMLYVLSRWVQDGKSKAVAEKKDRKPEPKQPFLVNKPGFHQARVAPSARRARTVGSRSRAQWAATQLEVNESEIVVRQRIVQVFASRLAVGREE